MPYIFPQPAKGQQCLFSEHGSLPAAAAFVFRGCLAWLAGEPRLSPQLRRLPRSAFSCAPASLPPRHLFSPALTALGLHLFKSSKILATISKVLFSWLSFSTSSIRPGGGRLGTRSAETSTSDDITIPEAEPGGQKQNNRS